MNGFVNLKVFATALVATVLAGPVIQWLMPTWSALVADVGPGGAWFVSIMYHIVYGIIIGAGAALAVAVLGRTGRRISLRSAGIAACLTVILFDVGFVLAGAVVSEFSYLAIGLALASFVVQILMALLPIGNDSSSVV